MTAQQSDILVLDGEEVRLFEAPLDKYIGSLGKGWPFAPRLSSNWRGYVATWTLEDDVLFLTEIRGWVATKPINASKPLDIRMGESIAASPARGMLDDSFHPPSIPLSFLFPGARDRVAATWYSGVLRVPRGELLEYVHMGFASIFEEDVLITIECGRATGRESVDNRARLVREWAERLVRMASGQLPTSVKIDPAVLRSALIEFSKASAARDLESADASFEVQVILKLAERHGFSELQAAVRAALATEAAHGST